MPVTAQDLRDTTEAQVPEQWLRELMIAHADKFVSIRTVTEKASVSEVARMLKTSFGVEPANYLDHDAIERTLNPYGLENDLDVVNLVFAQSYVANVHHFIENNPPYQDYDDATKEALKAAFSAEYISAHVADFATEPAVKLNELVMALELTNPARYISRDDIQIALQPYGLNADSPEANRLFAESYVANAKYVMHADEIYTNADAQTKVALDAIYRVAHIAAHSDDFEAEPTVEWEAVKTALGLVNPPTYASKGAVGNALQQYGLAADGDEANRLFAQSYAANAHHFIENNSPYRDYDVATRDALKAVFSAEYIAANAGNFAVTPAVKLNQLVTALGLTNPPNYISREDIGIALQQQYGLNADSPQANRLFAESYVANAHHALEADPDWTSYNANTQSILKAAFSVTYIAANAHNFRDAPADKWTALKTDLGLGNPPAPKTKANVRDALRPYGVTTDAQVNLLFAELYVAQAKVAMQADGFYTRADDVTKAALDEVFSAAHIAANTPNFTTPPLTKWNTLKGDLGLESEDYKPLGTIRGALRPFGLDANDQVAHRLFAESYVASAKAVMHADDLYIHADAQTKAALNVIFTVAYIAGHPGQFTDTPANKWIALKTALGLDDPLVPKTIDEVKAELRNYGIAVGDPVVDCLFAESYAANAKHVMHADDAYNNAGDDIKRALDAVYSVTHIAQHTGNFTISPADLWDGLKQGLGLEPSEDKTLRAILSALQPLGLDANNPEAQQLSAALYVSNAHAALDNDNDFATYDDDTKNALKAAFTAANISQNIANFTDTAANQCAALKRDLGLDLQSDKSLVDIDGVLTVYGINAGANEAKYLYATSHKKNLDVKIDAASYLQKSLKNLLKQIITKDLIFNWIGNFAGSAEDRLNELKNNFLVQVAGQNFDDIKDILTNMGIDEEDAKKIYIAQLIENKLADPDNQIPKGMGDATYDALEAVLADKLEGNNKDFADIIFAKINEKLADANTTAPDLMDVLRDECAVEVAQARKLSQALMIERALKNVANPAMKQFLQANKNDIIGKANAVDGDIQAIITAINNASQQNLNDKSFNELHGIINALFDANIDDKTKALFGEIHYLEVKRSLTQSSLLHEFFPQDDADIEQMKQKLGDTAADNAGNADVIKDHLLALRQDARDKTPTEIRDAMVALGFPAGAAAIPATQTAPEYLNRETKLFVEFQLAKHYSRISQLDDESQKRIRAALIKCAGKPDPLDAAEARLQNISSLFGKHNKNDLLKGLQVAQNERHEGWYAELKDYLDHLQKDTDGHNQLARLTPEEIKNLGEFFRTEHDVKQMKARLKELDLDNLEASLQMPLDGADATKGTLLQQIAWQNQLVRLLGNRELADYLIKNIHGQVTFENNVRADIYTLFKSENANQKIAEFVTDYRRVMLKTDKGALTENDIRKIAARLCGVPRSVHNIGDAPARPRPPRDAQAWFGINIDLAAANTNYTQNKTIARLALAKTPLDPRQSDYHYERGILMALLQNGNIPAAITERDVKKVMKIFRKTAPSIDEFKNQCAKQLGNLYNVGAVFDAQNNETTPGFIKNINQEQYNAAMRTFLRKGGDEAKAGRYAKKAQVASKPVFRASKDISEDRHLRRIFNENGFILQDDGFKLLVEPPTRYNYNAYMLGVQKREKVLKNLRRERDNLLRNLNELEKDYRKLEHATDDDSVNARKGQLMAIGRLRDRLTGIEQALQDVKEAKVLFTHPPKSDRFIIPVDNEDKFGFVEAIKIDDFANLDAELAEQKYSEKFRKAMHPDPNASGPDIFTAGVTEQEKGTFDVHENFSGKGGLVLRTAHAGVDANGERDPAKPVEGAISIRNKSHASFEIELSKVPANNPLAEDDMVLLAVKTGLKNDLMEMKKGVAIPKNTIVVPRNAKHAKEFYQALRACGVPRDKIRCADATAYENSDQIELWVEKARDKGMLPSGFDYTSDGVPDTIRSASATQAVDLLDRKAKDLKKAAKKSDPSKRWFRSVKPLSSEEKKRLRESDEKLKKDVDAKHPNESPSKRLR